MHKWQIPKVTVDNLTRKCMMLHVRSIRVSVGGAAANCCSRLTPSFSCCLNECFWCAAGLPLPGPCIGWQGACILNKVA